MFLARDKTRTWTPRLGSTATAFGSACILCALLCLGASVPLLRVHADEKKDHQRKFLELTKKYEAERERVAVERSETILALAELPIPQAVAFLQKALDAPKEDEIVRETILRALAKNGSASAVQIVLSKGFEILIPRRYVLIGDSLGKVSDPGALEWITKTGWKQIPQLGPEGQREYLRVLDATGDFRVTTGAAKLVGHPSLGAESQIGVIELLRRHRDVGSADKIARLIKFNDPSVRVTVLYALRDLEAAEHSKVFLDAVEDPDWQVRSAALDVLRATKDPEMIPYFLTALGDKAESVQISAIQALQELGGDSVMSPLIGALEKATGRVKDDLAEALVRLTGQDYGVDPLAWDAWWKANQGKVTIAKLSIDEYNRAKEKEDQKTTGLYYGLRVISQHVAFVIDVSGSMEEPYLVEDKEPDVAGGTGRTGVDKKKDGKRKKSRKAKIEVAREELISVIGGIKNGTQFNIIKFSGLFTPWQQQLVAMNEAVRSESMDFVKALSPGGETNVFDSLMFALDLKDVNTIYFLSDGAPTAGTVTDSKQILEKVAEANRVKKVKLYTIGFHLTPEAEELMQNLAEQNYGRFVKR
ncbi:MAG: HEAT repeat domain-containing protein [Planctomycetota bacterium]